MGILLALLAAGGARADIDQIARAVDVPDASAAPHAMEWVLLALGPAALGLFLWRRWHRLARSPRPPELPLLDGFALFVGMFVAGAVGATVAKALVGEPAADLDEAPLGVSAIVQGGAFAAQALFVLATRSWWRGEGAALGAAPPVAALAGVGALALFWPMVNVAVYATGFAIERLGGPTAEPVGHETLVRLLESPRDLWFWAIAALVVVPGPILEEILYRRILQGTLRPLVGQRWLAIGLTSLVFAAMHGLVAQPHAVAGVFVLSLGFGWVYERTGSLAAPIAMHMLFNAGNVALVVLLA